jgi:hypothetical protein
MDRMVLALQHAGCGKLDKSSSIRYSTLVVTVKVYEWSRFALDDSRRPWRLRNVINLLM